MKWFLSLLLAAICSPSQAVLIYAPDNLDANTARVIVTLHGCQQTAQDMSDGSGWNAIADENNLLLIYPEVIADPFFNPQGCWGWYELENQTPTSGELRRIVDEIDQAIADYHLENPKIFVNGISSGGATVSGLLACFPNKFSAGAVLSGLAYGLAQNMFEGLMVMATGPSPMPSYTPECRASNFKGNVMTIHGMDDFTVNRVNAEQVILDFIGNDQIAASSEDQENQLAYTTYDYASEWGAKGARC